MIDKKTFVLAVVVSWVLTLVTVLLISNFAPSLTQPFTQQFTESNSVKVVTFSKQEVQNVSETNDVALYFNFTWTPLNPNKNVILAIVLSFDYSCDELSSEFWENRTNLEWFLGSYVQINNYNPHFTDSFTKGAKNPSEWDQQWSSKWETFTSQQTIIHEPNNLMNQNQNKYPIQLTFAHNGQVSTYIRNVNLTLLVVDG